jgi:hypothetical protein
MKKALVITVLLIIGLSTWVLLLSNENKQLKNDVKYLKTVDSLSSNTIEKLIEINSPK